MNNLLHISLDPFFYLSPLLLVARVHGVVDERLVVVGPHESRVAVPLEQRVHVVGGHLEGVARRHRRLHRRLGRLHRLAVDVDLGLGARGQELAAKESRIKSAFDLIRCSYTHK